MTLTKLILVASISGCVPSAAADPGDRIPVRLVECAATEICDAVVDMTTGAVTRGLDENCNGKADGRWVNKLGKRCDADDDGHPCGRWVCNDRGSTVECIGDGARRTEELCNGLDDDCDGSVDNGFRLGGSCRRGKGACMRIGVFVCAQDATAGTVCSVGPGAPDPHEVCNGLDDDCDGLTDEGFRVGGDCSNGQKGECARRGRTVCNGRGGIQCVDRETGTRLPVVVAGVETCEGELDEDCDGLIDEDCR